MQVNQISIFGKEALQIKMRINGTVLILVSICPVRNGVVSVIGSIHSAFFNIPHKARRISLND